MMQNVPAEFCGFAKNVEKSRFWMKKYAPIRAHCLRLQKVPAPHRCGAEPMSSDKSLQPGDPVFQHGKLAAGEGLIQQQVSLAVAL